MRTPNQRTAAIIVWMAIAALLCLAASLIAHGWMEWLTQIAEG